MQSDIELAITGLSKDQGETLIDKIPRTYSVEDRFSTGYGIEGQWLMKTLLNFPKHKQGGRKCYEAGKQWKIFDD